MMSIYGFVFFFVFFLFFVFVFVFFFFQAEDGIRDHCVMEFRRVLFRSGVRVATRDFSHHSAQVVSISSL